jgi:hypothetical protein
VQLTWYFHEIYALSIWQWGKGVMQTDVTDGVHFLVNAEKVDKKRKGRGKNAEKQRKHARRA